MARLTDLAGKYAGRVAFVLGGGPSAPEQFKKCPEGALILSANHHGCLLTRCDYIVSQELSDVTHAMLRKYGVPIISPFAEADYLIEVPGLKVSGMEATRTAVVLGCSPVILAGMDCYVGIVEHWHRPDRTHTYGRNGDPPLPPRKLHKQLAAWSTLKGLGDIRVCGGPLTAVFPVWQGDQNRVR